MSADDARPGHRIFLVGPMGSGKTTLGRRVADLLELEFVDCDDEIESSTGASINLIFDIEGEAGFRDREARMLECLAQRDNVLVSTGGGAVLLPANRELMSRTGTVVWLKATVDQQIRRLELDRSRPLLQAPDRRKRLEELAAQRDPLYEAVADLAFTSGGRGVPLVAQALAKALREHHD
ncbi:shikimate kinase [Marinihelvus fidelis]|uniref:Shikimate kinase n=1 Tax=Marinihelvus fidelis TaxID=2613842 RepID=A0A5N0T8C1_9GAMM|nr:shikimate kinase [Marinihelvus fidelis]KAA9129559.1 shikimate kinase [Marinihelvus fidelis]